MSDSEKCAGATFLDVAELLDGKLAIVFLDDSGEDYYDFFTEIPLDYAPIRSIRLYNTPAEFVDGWERMHENPDGMWYWCFDCRGDENRIFCSGACDPNDGDGFAEYFGKDYREAYMLPSDIARMLEERRARNEGRS